MNMNQLFSNILCVALGSATGGVLRYLISELLARLCPMSRLPLGTLCVNVFGCFLIGFLSDLCWRGHTLSPETKLICITGFCGGFTTFSTFVNDDAKLFRDGHIFLCLFYLLLSFTLGMFALWMGNRLAKSIF